MSATAANGTRKLFEAVIISGPRRGEIVRWPKNGEPDVTTEEFVMLNEALNKLNASLRKLSAEIRKTTQAFRRRKRIC